MHVKRIAAVALLAASLAGPAPVRAEEPIQFAPVEGTERRVRLTFYLPTGYRTYSGVWPYVGSAACSWNYPLGTHLQFSDGRTVVCEDRGMLGSVGWVDVFAPTYSWGLHNIEANYGIYTTVRVVRPVEVRHAEPAFNDEGDLGGSSSTHSEECDQPLS